MHYLLKRKKNLFSYMV